jgi:hypothetical protein
MCPRSANQKHGAVFPQQQRARSKEVVDHYIELFKFIKAVNPPQSAAAAVASADGVNFDRPDPEERSAARVFAGCETPPAGR